MTEPDDISQEAQRVDALYRAKARVEIEAAEALVSGPGVVRGQGDHLADVLLVKGSPGSTDREKGRALAGEDGAAIGKALDALGLPKSRFALCTRVGAEGADRLQRLLLLTEAIDPRTVILLDAEAAEDFAEAYAIPVPVAGEVGRALGRELLVVDGFEASLVDEARKRRVWRQLRALDRAKHPVT